MEKQGGFHNYFSNIVNNNQRFKNLLNEKVEYQIVFMNAVQYQASEGRKPLNKEVRDFNWIYFWAATGNNSFSRDLIKRIKKFPKESIIINLCTFGDHNLQNFVTLKLNYCKRAFFIGYHPCTWFYSCRRVIK